MAATRKTKSKKTRKTTAKSKDLKKLQDKYYAVLKRAEKVSGRDFQPAEAYKSKSVTRLRKDIASTEDALKKYKK